MVIRPANTFQKTMYSDSFVAVYVLRISLNCNGMSSHLCRKSIGSRLTGKKLEECFCSKD